MKFDTIIIGGGLTGLVSGIALQQKGQRVCIISYGQSTLHFSSGSFSGEQPDTAIAAILAQAGVKTISAGYRLTPLGELRPAALTLEDYYHSPAPEMPEHTVSVVRVPGYLGLPIEFLVDTLSAAGKVVSVITPDEMAASPADVILLPASAAALREKCGAGRPIRLIATLPPSIPGQTLRAKLQQRFGQLGGTFIAGDRVVGCSIVNGRVEYVETQRLADERLFADHFILATGSFQSEGLQSNYDRIWEPIFGAKVNAPDDRTQWTALDFFGDQPYQQYGVCRDADGHAIVGQQPVMNLYPAGHILGGLRDEITNLNEALEVCRKLV